MTLRSVHIRIDYHEDTSSAFTCHICTTKNRWLLIDCYFHHCRTSYALIKVHVHWLCCGSWTATCILAAAVALSLTKGTTLFEGQARRSDKTLRVVAGESVTPRFGVTFSKPPKAGRPLRTALTNAS